MLRKIDLWCLRENKKHIKPINSQGPTCVAFKKASRLIRVGICMFAIREQHVNFKKN